MLREMSRGAIRAWGRSDWMPGRLYQVVERLGPGLAAAELLPTTLPNGCRISCDLRDHVQRHQWFFGAYEPIEALLFSRLLRPGMACIDAGANVGQYTLLAAKGVGPSGSVHAFEPVPRTMDRLREAVERNRLTNVTLNRAALWSEEETLNLGLPDDELDGSNCGSYSVGIECTSPVVAAPGVRLGDYVAEAGVGRVDLIKMDVEGSEPQALAGAWGVLERDRPAILMEINREALLRAGSSPSALGEMLRSLGYRAWQIGLSARESGPVPEVADIDRANVLLHHDDLPSDVTGGWDVRFALRWARSGW